VTDEQSPCAVIAILAVALFGALSGVARAELDGDEAAIRDSIYARRGTMVETLSGYVDRNTGTWNTEGLTSFASTLAEELEALDFEVEIEPGATLELPGRPGARTGPRVFAHRPQRLRIAPGPKVLLVGHMDTVLEPASPFQRLEVDAASPDHATGPGVIDMKGGLVVLLEALRALRDSGDLNRTAFTVLLDSDEEIGSLGSRASSARDAASDSSPWTSEVSPRTRAAHTRRVGTRYESSRRRSCESSSSRTTREG
jgi:glutamate carboxypeptidase